MFEEFEQLASMENAKLKHKQQLWIEVGKCPDEAFASEHGVPSTGESADHHGIAQVCLGAGWTLERSAFFPRSALKCLVAGGVWWGSLRKEVAAESEKLMITN